MKKTFKTILVLTNTNGAIWKFDASDKLIISQGKMQSNIPFKEFDVAVVSDDEIKEGDLYMNKFGRLSIRVIGDKSNEGDKKIVATTNKEITPDCWIDLSKESWIVDYFNLNNKLPEVDIEGADMIITTREHLLTGSDEWKRSLANPVWMPKTNEDNSVIITPSKMFSTSETETLVKKALSDFISKYVVSNPINGGFDLPKWLKENISNS